MGEGRGLIMTATTKAGTVSIGDLRVRNAEYRRISGHAVGTAAMDLRVFRILEEDLGLRYVAELEDPDVIRRFETAIPGDSILTRRARLNSLQGILRRGQRWGMIRSVPPFPDIVRLSARRLPKQLSGDNPRSADVNRLLDYLRSWADSWEGHRIYALVTTVCLAGIAVQQALRLRVADIDLAASTIRLPGGRLRRPGPDSPSVPIRIGPELRAILAGWVRETKCEWAFPGIEQIGRWGTRSAWRRKRAPSRSRRKPQSPSDHLEAAVAAAGIERPITFGSLRRYYAENAVSSPPTRVGPITRPESTTSPATPKPAVELDPEGRSLSVRGISKRPPRGMALKALKLLTDAYPGGLDGKKMSKGYGSEGWNTILDRFRNKDEDLRSAILFPRDRPDDTTAGLYRIAAW